MRRTGRLFESLVERGNLKLAWVKASRGKSRSPAALAYGRDLGRNLEALRSSLLDGSVPIGRYEYFTIRDPKERLICAASFPERVLHHALMNLLDPVFERFQMADSYACRVGKGTRAAVLRAFRAARGSPGSARFFLKMDVRKYFDSIDHAILKVSIERIIKDGRVLDLLSAIIDSYHAFPGKGLPIGNLTSQYFANHYLAALDHRAKEAWRCGTWIRYMDDIVSLAESVPSLRSIYERTAEFCVDSLALALKPAVIDDIRIGLPFLGFLIKPDGIFLTRRTKGRFARKSRETAHSLASFRISESAAAASATARCAFVSVARSMAFRYRVFNGRFLGRGQRGWPEPRESWRQLEQ